MKAETYRRLQTETRTQQRIKARLAAWWYVNHSEEYRMKKAAWEAAQNELLATLQTSLSVSSHLN